MSTELLSPAEPLSTWRASQDMQHTVLRLGRRPVCSRSLLSPGAAMSQLTRHHYDASQWFIARIAQYLPKTFTLSEFLQLATVCF